MSRTASWRARWRTLAMGAATISGAAARGFFIPYRHAGAIRRPTDPYAAIASRFAAAEPEFARLLATIDAFSEALCAIPKDGGAPEPRWRQGWFPRLDAAAAYAIVRERRPRRIVEVGSGHSTRFLRRAVRDGGLDCAITAIDPAPRAPLPPDVRHLAIAVQDAGDAPFAGLEPGDVVFWDSSHILMPGSDVDYLLNRIWPTLPAGALVHVHDIFLPDDYPESWWWRGYNEQNALAPLLASGATDVRFASHYVATRMPDTLARTSVRDLPLMEGAVETSLWLAKR